MIEGLVQSGYTGLGDNVIGYVSMYILKKQLEKLYGLKDLKLYTQWNYIHCPYVKAIHQFQQHFSKRKMPTITCLHSGEDGTAAFGAYYKSHRMIHDINHKTYIKIVINQYVGKCFIDETTTREDVKKLTYEAFDYFWNNVIDHSIIPKSVRENTSVHDNLSAIYVRLGDQYLCEKKTNAQQPLTECYKYLCKETIQSPIALVGDVNNQVMKDTYCTLYGDQHDFVQIDGPVTHSLGCHADQDWQKIFTDLYLILNAKSVYIMSYYSNFVRIVLFLKNSRNKQVYMLKDDRLIHVNDLSTIFAKHYQF